jgi:hypothetical protein
MFSNSFPNRENASMSVVQLLGTSLTGCGVLDDLALSRTEASRDLEVNISAIAIQQRYTRSVVAPTVPQKKR